MGYFQFVDDVGNVLRQRFIGDQAQSHTRVPSEEYVNYGGYFS